MDRKTAEFRLTGKTEEIYA